MESYRRIVSYLYRYTKEGKADNTGFVRVETRGEQMKLQFRIRDLRMMERKNLTVHFYYHENGEIRPVYVDTFLCDRGSCEYKKSYPVGTYRFEEMKGVLFFDGEDLLYGSCWDEKEIRADKIRRKEYIAELEKSEAENVEAEQEEAEQAETEQEQEITEPELETERKEIRKIEDLAELPEEFRRFLENPFLQQGFELYGYVILRNINGDKEEEKTILGVPGIYDNREKYLAQRFGFPDYIPEEESEIWTGKRGYWCKKVKE